MTEQRPIYVGSEGETTEHMPDTDAPPTNVGQRLELDEHGLPTGEERRRAAYTVALLPVDLRLRFIREVGQQIGYDVSRHPSDAPQEGRPTTPQTEALTCVCGKPLALSHISWDANYSPHTPEAAAGATGQSLE
jgi:hypothetical protein